MPVPAPADAALADAAVGSGGSAGSNTGASSGLLLAHPAIRCAECHNKMHSEWSPSAHARAATSPLYRKMRDAAGPAGAGCDDCHAPLAKRVRPGDRPAELAAKEGVTCEVCHSIKAVEVKKTGAGYDLSLGRVKFGPLCDAKDHYFHRMGCSKLHTQAELCAGCHLYYRQLPGGGELPVFTEYEEWSEGPYQARECQSCHMPGSRAEVADGHGVREGVSHHGWLGGEKSDLRKTALAAVATVTATGTTIAVEVRVENVRGGHHVPTGLPERRIIVRATSVGAGGAQHATAEHAFGRSLVDAAGKPAPFYAAVRVASDTRIPPKQSRKVRLELEAPDAGELRIEVVWRPLAEEIRTQLAVPAEGEVPLLRATAALKPPQGGGRPDLPRTIELQR